MATKVQPQPLGQIRDRFEGFQRAKGPRQNYNLSSEESASLINNTKIGQSSTNVPEWLQIANTIKDEHFQIIKDKLKNLAQQHQLHLQPSFERDESDVEHSIDVLSNDIEERILKIHKMIKIFKSIVASNPEEETTKSNLEVLLATELREIVNIFRKQQQDYLKTLSDRKKLLLGAGKIFVDLATGSNPVEFTKDQQDQLQRVIQNSDQRQKEILQIVKEVTALNQLWQDLSLLVVEQGSLLDRIDYNVEHAVRHMDEANSELTKASQHQKSYRSKLCLFLLCILVFVGVLAFIVKLLAT